MTKPDGYFETLAKVSIAHGTEPAYSWVRV